MAWWAYAISHGVNPFLTNVIWAPSGVNLAWTANMPLAAWLVYPVTRVFGPIVSYNLLCLLAPAFAGWSAFVLCRYVVRGCWPAMLGGLLFAFSPYVLSRMLGNMDLTLVWPIPLAAYVTLRRIDGNLGARSFVAALAILIAAQFLSFAEIVASATLFGAIAFLLAAPAMAPQERGACSRPRPWSPPPTPSRRLSSRRTSITCSLSRLRREGFFRPGISRSTS
jgi:hypothetical protein